jgi:hypothetical protein
MAKKKSFIPNARLDKKQNGKVFKEQAAIDGISFDLTALQVTEIATKWGAFDTQVSNQTTIDAAVKTQTTLTQNAEKAFVDCWRKYAGKMKKSDTYTETVGERYDIIGEDHTIDVPNSKPIFEESKVPAGWQLDFNLHDFFSGVYISRKRPGATVFTYLATDTSAPYIDTDAQVDGTEYEGYYLMGDTKVGQAGYIAIKV